MALVQQARRFSLCFRTNTYGRLLRTAHDHLLEMGLEQTSPRRPCRRLWRKQHPACDGRKAGMGNDRAYFFMSEEQATSKRSTPSELSFSRGGRGRFHAVLAYVFKFPIVSVRICADHARVAAC
ncbi:hypothetical protein BV20DRAFT_504781 [Pilatotrama ljubarskyi]|nr:hypothetical protein BV20DRAFT_504781 [Pilatotrama ljubarskyi]